MLKHGLNWLRLGTQQAMWLETPLQESVFISQLEELVAPDYKP